jgi:hypothetical protein
LFLLQGFVILWPPTKGVVYYIVYKVITGNSWKSPICKGTPKTGPDFKKKNGYPYKATPKSGPRVPHFIRDIRKDYAYIHTHIYICINNCVHIRAYRKKYLKKNITKHAKLLKQYICMYVNIVIFKYITL